MIAGSILFGLIAMVSYGLSNVYMLPIAKRLGNARALFLRGLFTCLVLLVVAIPTLSHLSHWQAALAAVAIGVLGYLPPLSFTHGMRVSRISIVAPIAGTSPLITVLLSCAFLGTQLRPSQWIGVVLIICANIIMSFNFRSLRESNILNLASGIPFAVITALLWGVVFFLIIYPTRTLGPQLSILLLEVGVVIGAGIHVALRREKFDLPQAFKPQVMINACLIAAGGLAFAIGVKSFNVGIVAALSNSIAIVSIIAASLIHHERLTTKEKILAAAMIVGVVIISV